MVAQPGLSKEEMTELASALSVARERVNAPRSEVRTYSFANPERLSSLHLRALQMIFSGLERAWSGSLSVAAKDKVSVQVNPVQQTPFRGYAESISASGVIFELSMDFLPGIMLIDMPLQMAWSLVDRMVGGSGKAPGELQPLTDIQKGILRNLVERLLPDLTKAWENVTLMKLSIVGMHSSVESIEMESSEPMVVAGTIWSTETAEGAVSIALPVSALEEIMDSLDPQRWLKIDETRKKASPESMTGLLKAVDVLMQVGLGHARITMQDVLNMEIGDVVMLDSGVSDGLEVRIGDKVRFYGRPGLVGKKVSVQIVERAERSSLNGKSSENK